MIIGTAGHIDHGKSLLVEALTGQAMDRLAEERKRGITIELNFAPLDLGGGRVAGVVDVPGHEDFVRTMVAGASGVDLVLLVVAADEGLMPQTLEHLAIVEQLGLVAGIPVISKADLVEPELAEVVAAEVEERLARSVVRFRAPIVVSAKTGVGIDALRGAIRDAAAEVVPRPHDLFRLPVDRAFSLAGVGTVVTGTAWSGSVAVGETVLLMPAGREARVRSVEMHGTATERSESGARTALGFAGVDRDAVRRGDVIVTRGAFWAPTTALDVQLALQPEAARPLAPRTRVHLHLGTAEVLARVYPRGEIRPGCAGLARLALEAPVVARGGDRFVLRSYSPVITIGGGRVLDPLPPRRGAEWPAGLGSRDPAMRLRALVERRSYGVSGAEVPVLLGVPPEAAVALAASDAALRTVGDHLLPAARVAGLVRRSIDILDTHHRAHPADAGLPVETLRSGLGVPMWLAEGVVEIARQERALEVDGSAARLPGFRPRVAGGDAEVERLAARVARAGLAPPTIAELEIEYDRRDVAATLRLAAQRGLVTAVARDRYCAGEALAGFEAALRELGAAGDITVAALRDRLGLSRKYLIPLLEWADARGVTVRLGDVRRLRTPTRA